MVSNDIVARLRKEWEYGNNAQGCDYEMFAEAADEIERLRKIIAEYHIAEVGYEESLDDDDSAIRPEWLRAWDALEKEGKKILGLSSKNARRRGKL